MCVCMTIMPRKANIVLHKSILRQTYYIKKFDRFKHRIVMRQNDSMTYVKT